MFWLWFVIVLLDFVWFYFMFCLCFGDSIKLILLWICLLVVLVIGWLLVLIICLLVVFFCLLILWFAFWLVVYLLCLLLLWVWCDRVWFVVLLAFLSVCFTSILVWIFWFVSGFGLVGCLIVLFDLLHIDVYVFWILLFCFIELVVNYLLYFVALMTMFVIRVVCC